MRPQRQLVIAVVTVVACALLLGAAVADLVGVVARFLLGRALRLWGAP